MNTIPQASEEVPRPEPGVISRFIQWFFSGRVMRRWLFAAACLATLIGLFYAVENWRGKRAWEACRRELEAQGAVLDWNAYIPAPVPDEQNIYKAPNMKEWFVRSSFLDNGRNHGAKAPQGPGPFASRHGSNPVVKEVLVAEVKVVLPATPSGSEQADAVLRFDDPRAREQAEKLLAAAMGPCADGAMSCVILARPLDQINPVHLALEAETTPTLKALAEFIPRSTTAHAPFSATSQGGFHFAVATAGSNQFRVSLSRWAYAAADYLAYTQPVVPDFDLVRKAIERPYARIDGDYQRPFARPIPNFVVLRTVAQMLSQRAQCYLLLGQPEAAWHELELVRDMCRMLEGNPPGKATTLVEAMINVAITGLYTQVIEDGIRLHAWREPELVAMQQQLKDVNLLPLLKESMDAERAAACHTMEATPPAKLNKWFGPEGGKRTLWETLNNPESLLIRFMPRGWALQNMCAVALREGLTSEIVDIPNNEVLPRKADDISNQIQSACSHSTPYTFLASAVVPNVMRASQVLARNQTLVNEAYLACGLERYRLAHGQYPDTLEALVPQFAEKLPHDLIGGQPLKYRRTADGQFLLYSVGWNEKDDGGIPGKTTGEGDWVWQLPSS